MDPLVRVRGKEIAQMFLKRCALVLSVLAPTPSTAVDITQCSQVANGDASIVSFPGKAADGAAITLRAIFARRGNRSNSRGIVMVPGSTGLFPPYCYRAVVEDFLAAGFTVLLLSPSNATASDGRVLRNYSFFDLAVYAGFAANWLGARPEIDAAQIGLWGHSRGGGSVIFAVSDPNSQAHRTFRYAVAAAPQCFDSLPEPKLPLLLLIGTEDKRVSVEACADYAQRHPGSENLNYVELPGGGHSFWAPSDTAEERQAARMAARRLHGFLDKAK